MVFGRCGRRTNAGERRVRNLAGRLSDSESGNLVMDEGDQKGTTAMETMNLVTLSA